MPITKTNKKKNGLQGYCVRVNFTDPVTGEYKRIERTAYGKAEAQAMEQKLLAEVSGGEHNTNKMKVSALCEEYINVKRQEVRETTLDQIIRQVNRGILPYIGDKSIDSITVSIMQNWKTEIGALDLALKTKQGVYTTTNGIFNYAYTRGYIQQNPLTRIGNFKDVYFEKPQDTLHYYTPDQYITFASTARRSAETKNTLQEWGYYVFFSLAFYTGARKGEINALKWSDVDGNILHIRRSIAQKLKGEDRETPPKNKSSYRDLQIPQPMMDILAEQKERQKSDPRFSDDWRICGGDRCLRDTSIDKKNQQYATESGLPHIRIHDFRHTHASLLANNGINIQEVARRLGHSNVEQTWSTYAHLYPKEEERAVSILDKIR